MNKSSVLDFGFLPEELEIPGEAVAVSTKQNLAELVSEVRQHNRVANRWYYPPLEPLADWRGGNSTPPLVPAVKFGLPQTHTIEVPVSGDPGWHLCEFLVLLLGVLKGLKLTPAGWFHFYRVAIEPKTLSDFTVEKYAVSKILELASSYWLSHPEVQSRLLGAVHWQLFSKSYAHWFEVFEGQYRVIDTCYEIRRRTAGMKKQKHYQRISALCESLELPVPDWAVPNGKESEVSKLRNDLVHEGLVAEHGTSLQTPSRAHEIEYELGVLTTRVLLALVGLRHPYLTTVALNHPEPYTLKF